MSEIIDYKSLQIVSPDPSPVADAGLAFNENFKIIADNIESTAALIATLAPKANPSFTGTITGNGSTITAINASNLASGTVPASRLGTGTADNTTFLRGDHTWQVVSGGSETLAEVLTNGNDAGTHNITGVGTLTIGTGITFPDFQTQTQAFSGNPGLCTVLNVSNFAGTNNLDMSGQTICDVGGISFASVGNAICDGGGNLYVCAAGALVLSGAGGVSLGPSTPFATNGNAIDLGCNIIAKVTAIQDTSNANSVDITNRQLLAADGATVLLDWSNGLVMNAPITFDNTLTVCAPVYMSGIIAMQGNALNLDGSSCICADGNGCVCVNATSMRLATSGVLILSGTGGIALGGLVNCVSMSGQISMNGQLLHPDNDGSTINAGGGCLYISSDSGGCPIVFNSGNGGSVTLSNPGGLYPLMDFCHGAITGVASFTFDDATVQTTAWTGTDATKVPLDGSGVMSGPLCVPAIYGQQVSNPFDIFGPNLLGNIGFSGDADRTIKFNSGSSGVLTISNPSSGAPIVDVGGGTICNAIYFGDGSHLSGVTAGLPINNLCSNPVLSLDACNNVCLLGYDGSQTAVSAIQFNCAGGLILEGNPGTFIQIGVNGVEISSGTGGLCITSTIGGPATLNMQGGSICLAGGNIDMGSTGCILNAQSGQFGQLVVGGGIGVFTDGVTISGSCPIEFASGQTIQDASGTMTITAPAVSIVAGDAVTLNASSYSFATGDINLNASVSINNANQVNSDSMSANNITINSNIFAAGLPTTDPHVAGQVWNSGGLGQLWISLG